ncbi:hypothetical protein [Verrucomicrobium spinosum]|uniref:hypothetical protein n=1 Tax=Verrucomicrobium spinosum TaxID=2736 RepID=UPI00210C0966|nr:hypothetical protein [Verrucomicrobium spinosum]
MEDSEGTKYLYDVPPAMGGSSASSLLLSITDKYGTSLNITHNVQGAISAISHPAAVTTLSPTGTWSFVYGANGKVSHIDDPFGRQATFTYDVNNRLTGQTDMGAVAYGYGYTTASLVTEPDPANPSQTITRTNELFLNAITTPSGTTQFLTEPSDGVQIGSDTYAPPGGPMWSSYRITITDPLGAQEEYFYAALYTGWHRDKNHYKSGVPAYGGASAALADPHTRYYYTLVNGKGELSEVKHQGGATTYFSSYDQGGRPLGKSSTNGHSDSFVYNARGMVLSHATSHGGQVSYEYATNGIDVLSVKRLLNGEETVLSEYEYDGTTGDLAATVDQAGLRTEYERNARGQVVSVTRASGDVAVYQYNSAGWLESVKLQAIGHPNEITLETFEYDDVGRLVGQSNFDGYVLLYTYDDLNRRIQTTYPGGETTVNTYSCCNLVSVKSRDNSITQYGYDALKRLRTVVGPQRQVASYSYDKVGNLTEIQFGRGEKLKWAYDAADRVVAKTNPDGTQVSLQYDPLTGRLNWTKDTENRASTYAYNTLGLVTSIQHDSLPLQSFTYDELGRRLTWTDGARITSYEYDAIGRLVSIDGPLANDTITYTYDSLGRMSSWEYDGAAESYTFDSLDRIANVENPLGTFSFSYLGDTGLVSSVQYPIPGVSATYSRDTNIHGRRLVETRYEGSGSVEIARFDYTYDSGGKIETWSQHQPG